MALEWSNENVIHFIELIQTEPCLWDPGHKNFKNRSEQNQAWSRIKQSLHFQASIEEMKKKKETLMCYYRTHLNRYKKSLLSGVEYSTTWFAYETMDSFLREVYASSPVTLNTEVNNCNEAQENSTVEDGETRPNIIEVELSPTVFVGIDDYDETQEWDTVGEEEMGQIIKEEVMTPREMKPSQDHRKRQLKDDLPPEFKVARRKIDEAFEFIKEMKDNEHQCFGKFISSKLSKIRNPNIRDILMNDIHNLVFRACKEDQNDQFSPSRFQTSSNSVYGPTYTFIPNITI